MSEPQSLVEVWRGDLIESLHVGHAVIVGETGEIETAWGDPQALIYPRSSCKMVQALPLVESGLPLSDRQLALACASHNGAAMHLSEVSRWLADLGLSDSDLRCGPQLPDDRAERERIIRAGERPGQCHNNCSGKHTGFLALSQHLHGGAEYVEADHPVQRLVRTAFEDVVQEDSPTYAIDGCSAPNFACTLAGLARGAAAFASAGNRSDPRSKAMVQLTEAMMAHPVLVAGEKRACTELMRAARGQAAIKTGAEGVFLAILPGLKKGIALKISDGATRASNCVMAALLVRLGVLPPTDPAVLRFANAPLFNRRKIEVGTVRPVAGLMG